MIVGVDVSKDYLDVALGRNGEPFRITNDSVGFDELVKRLQGLDVKLVVMEASGGYEQACAAHLIIAKVPTAIVNPRQVRDFAKAMNKLAKTDGIDAGTIAHFGEAIERPAATLDDDATIELRALVDRRSQLVEMRTMESNRKQLAPAPLKKELDQHIVWLNSRIKDIEKDINARIRKSKAWLERAKLLETAMGIGRTTSAKLIVDLPELGRVTPKQIAALVGTAPFNDDSGKRQGQRYCRGGRADVRTALYMPTTVAISHDPKLGEFYARLTAKGKPHNVALIACMRKLLIMLNAMVRTNTPWTPA